jgi:hypothetical protein
VAATLSACLFPSLDGLTDGGAPNDATSEGSVNDAANDVVTQDATSDAGTDATIEAGLCPPNSDKSLVVYFPFDEGSGSIAHDCSGNGYDALLSGTTTTSTWTTGHSKGAIAFDSSNTTCVIVASASANQSGANPLTLSAWYSAASSAGGGYIVGQRHQTGYAWRVDVETDDAGFHANFAVGTNDDAGDDFSASSLTATDSFHHVAAVYDPSGPTQTLYLDGVVVDTETSAPAIVLDPIASTIRIGCRADDSNYFDGVIDEVRVYSRALSASEIATLAK